MQHGTRARLPRFGTRIRSFALAVLAAGLALVMAACGGGTGGSEAPPAGGGAPATGQAPSNQVTVQMTEFALALPQQNFAPGAYTFVAVNAGRTVHALKIEGPGIREQQTPNVQPGQSASLTVNLQQPGTYEMYCPVGNHKGMGMRTEITVGGAGGPPPTTDGGGGSGGGY